MNDPEPLIIEPPRIVQAGARRTASIHMIIPRAEIVSVMGPAIGELLEVLEAQGIAPSGRWFSHHLRFHPDFFDFEVGAPVPTPVQPQGRVRPSQLPAGTVARTHYLGDYDALPDAWAHFDAWVLAEGHIPAAEFWETYLIGPDLEDDPAAWRTELNRPLRATAAPKVRDNLSL